MDAKLKVQLTKLLQAATSGGDGGAVKPRPTALVTHDADAAAVDKKKKKKDAGKAGKGSKHAAADSGDDGDGGDDKDAGAGVYKPLKRSAVLFDDKRGSGRAERESRRAVERASKSQLFKDILEQYTEAPREVQ